MPRGRSTPGAPTSARCTPPPRQGPRSRWRCARRNARFRSPASPPLDPLAEHGWQLLIRAELAAGRRAEAAHAFHACRAGLRRDLGLEPDVRTRELFADVLAGHAV
uniref:AfsR/SARP family transcriptional regulator n=1 Tax=Pseudonocardia charpentierae TaxID=3075545 RepID=UPI0037CCA9F8